jgi:outer membrane protein assembly factor BamB
MKHRSLVACVGLAAFALSLGSRAAAADWYRWRGPDLNGISTEAGWSTSWPKEGPPVVWRTNVGTGFSSVTVRQGRVYTMGHGGESDVVFCLEAATGKMLWRHAYAAPLDDKYYEGGPTATPTVDGGRVFTMSKRGRVFCLEALSGKVVWERDLGADPGLPYNEWGLAGSPLIEGELVVLNVGSAGTALDTGSGRVVWTSDKETTGYASAVPFTLDGTRGVALFAAKHLKGVELATGRELWRYPWETGYDNNNADPIIVGNRIFISSYSRGCALLEVRGGRVPALYENTNMHNHMSTCVKIGEHLYGFNGREGRGRPNDFRCIEFLTSQVKWTTTGLGVGGLVAADNRLIILSETGELVIAEARPDMFKPLARAQVLGGRCWTPPVLSGGRIFCRNARGDLACLDVSGAGTASR